MSVVASIDAVRDWLESEVCSKIKLKVADDEEQDGAYQYELVQPFAFSLFVPTKDRLPPKVAAPVPSVCVRLMAGQDDIIKKRRGLRIQLCFAAWDPGAHAPDIIRPDKSNPGKFIRQLNDTGAGWFEGHGVGWRDAWNFVDLALREIESAEYVGGLRVLKEDMIDFGPMADQEGIADWYPYWFAWLEFSVQEGVVRNPAAYEKLL